MKLGKYNINSRVIVGTGKYENFDIMKQAHEASGTDCITVAIRRVNLNDPKENILNFIDTKKYTLLPNTAGCFNAEEAIRIAHLAREIDPDYCEFLEEAGEKEIEKAINKILKVESE